MAGLEDVNNRSERANGIGNVVGTVGEGEGRSGKYLHPRKEKEGGLSQRLLLQGAGENEDGHPHHCADHAHDQQVLKDAEIESGVLETLEHHHGGDDDGTNGG